MVPGVLAASFLEGMSILRLYDSVDGDPHTIYTPVGPCQGPTDIEHVPHAQIVNAQVGFRLGHW